ncbi:MAG: hypothetical protein IPJ74_25845 [Saprospiraceae bacterium]|nr:hypothetical protein [Saprospiraceae bacterium]
MISRHWLRPAFLVQRDDKTAMLLAENKAYKTTERPIAFLRRRPAVLYRAIDQVASTHERGQRLKKKLASLYDYHRLGHAYLRKPPPH